MRSKRVLGTLVIALGMTTAGAPMVAADPGGGPGQGNQCFIGYNLKSNQWVNGIPPVVDIDFGGSTGGGLAVDVYEASKQRAGAYDIHQFFTACIAVAMNFLDCIEREVQGNGNYPGCQFPL